ncbi:MAG: CFAP77 family protein, partial [Flammeovirgaceae bacterium]
GFLPWDRTGNRLLVKSQLGRNKPTNYEIPEENFVYGKLTNADAEKSNEVIYNWKYHNNLDNKNHLKNKDFVETNKEALHRSLHTSAQCYQHQKTNTLYKPVKEGNHHVKINFLSKVMLMASRLSMLLFIEFVRPYQTCHGQYLRSR